MDRRAFFLVSWIAAIPAVAFSQAVQLPVYQQFGISTTVIAPDRGSAALGAVDRARESRVTLGGVAPNRISADRAHGATSSHVRAEVHDFQAMEPPLLAAGAASNPAGVPAADAAERTAALACLRGGDTPLPSVAEIRRQRQEKQQQLDQEALALVQQAQQARSPEAARAYYLMAAARASGELKQSILAKLRPAPSPGDPGTRGALPTALP